MPPDIDQDLPILTILIKGGQITLLDLRPPDATLTDTPLPAVVPHAINPAAISPWR